MATSVWRGRITFGLVSIPVRLVKAARRERTRFRRIQLLRPEGSRHEHDDDIAEVPLPPSKVLEFPSEEKQSNADSAAAPADLPGVEESVVRVRNALVSGQTGAPAIGTEILKGYEIAKDEFAVIRPEEVTALRPRTSSELEITEFVKLEEIDPLYYETSYYVRPEAGGEKTYALLFATLRETGHAGMGSLAMHGREHVVLIRAGGEALVLHSMFYANEVGRPEYRLEGDGANAKELELAKLLVSALEARFEPEKWKDRFEERLKALIESRTPIAASDKPRGGTGKAPGADIMEALRKSLEMARKPVAREQTPAKTKRRSASNRKA